MPNVLLFHCPNCDTIEPRMFHRNRNELDGCYLKGGPSDRVVCAICKHEEPLYANVASIPDWVFDKRKVYNKIWNCKQYVEVDD